MGRGSRSAVGDLLDRMKAGDEAAFGRNAVARIVTYEAGRFIAAAVRHLGSS